MIAIAAALLVQRHQKDISALHLIEQVAHMYFIVCQSVVQESLAELRRKFHQWGRMEEKALNLGGLLREDLFCQVGKERTLAPAELCPNCTRLLLTAQCQPDQVQTSDPAFGALFQ